MSSRQRIYGLVRVIRSLKTEASREMESDDDDEAFLGPHLPNALDNTGSQAENMVRSD